jgi:acyl-CoA synthetase (AMP-forming)/AMP-acid ligase II
MSPVDFLQKPVRWLQAISNYRATISGSPNFAYDLCVRKVTPEQIESLDLSSWQVAYNGAEPIRADTLKAFAKKFAPSGFREEALYPCYGMAEATLMISGGDPSRLAIVKTVDALALGSDRVVPSTDDRPAVTLVGCGKTREGQILRIVDPDSLQVCPTGTVGEIWVSGPSVAGGYWSRPEKTEETFHARIRETGEGPFLRTGDLGFLDEDGELFITGRLKDVIIIRGRNHYPQDIERTVERSHRALIPDRCAAFSVVIDGEEKLAIAVEVERRFRDRRHDKDGNSGEDERRKSQRRAEHPDPGFEVELEKPPVYDEIVSAIRQAVVADHGLQVHAILLLRVGTIPKTSSGKLQRYACRKGFIEKTLTTVYSTHP